MRVEAEDQEGRRHRHHGAVVAFYGVHWTAAGFGENQGVSALGCFMFPQGKRELTLSNGIHSFDN